MIASLLNDLRLFLLLVIVSLLIIVLDNLHLLNLPKQLVQTLTTPIQFGLYKTSIGVEKQFEFIVRARTAAQEKKALEEQLASVISENARLRSELGVAQGSLLTQQSLDPKVYNLVSAKPVSLSRYLTIDKGFNDGLKVGMPVVYKDTYLGQIKNLSPQTAEVILSTDPDSKIAAFVQESSGKGRGILTGQFGSEMLLDKILHQETISAGDLVYSEGTEGKLPRGLVLGTVSEVLSRENEIFKQARVSQIFRVNDLDIVFVITN